MGHFGPKKRPLVLIATVTCLILGLAPGIAVAIDVEPYVFAAQTSGSLDFSTGIACIAIVGTDCPVAASTEDGDDDAWGLGAALRISGPWWVDLRWTRQDTSITLLTDQGQPVSGPTIALDVDRLEAGILYRFLDRPWSPFLTAFGGVARYEALIGTSERAEIDLDGTSIGLGAGLLVDLGSRLGLRLEVRGSRTDLPEDFGGDLEQVEGSVGLRFRL